LVERPSTRELVTADRRLSRGPVLAAAMMAIVLTATEGSIVATAMPTIVAEFGGFDLFSWAFAAFLLTQAVSIPIYGRLADQYGRKPVFFTGASLFLIASLLCGLAWGMEPLIFFRALQGGRGRRDPADRHHDRRRYLHAGRAGTSPGVPVGRLRRGGGLRPAARRLSRRAGELVLRLLDQPPDRRVQLCDAGSLSA
jgi:hypothetical protein